MELQHLAYSLLEQYARQFFLMNRREPYRNDGRHDLWLRVGGSAGHGGLWAVHVEEGLVGEDFTGRRWEVSVRTPDEAGEAAATERDAATRDKQREKMRADEEAVLEAIDAEVERGIPGATLNRIELATGFSYGRAKDAIRRLAEAGAIVETEVTVRGGHGASQTAKGYCRDPD